MSDAVQIDVPEGQVGIPIDEQLARFALIAFDGFSRLSGPELMKVDALFTAVTDFATRLGFTPMKEACLLSALCRLRKRGHVSGPRGRYRLTIEKPKPLAIVRGAQIVKHFQACCRVDSLSDLQL